MLRRMNRLKLLVALTLFALTCSLPVFAQEKGTWRAASTTARSITGDLVFSNEKLSINFSAFPIAQIRQLTPAEITATFSPATTPTGFGNLYRLAIPAGKVFLHKNTLCGSEDTQWLVTWVEGRTLQIAFFSGPQMPVLTPEAVANSTSLCGTYTYVR